MKKVQFMIENKRKETKLLFSIKKPDLSEGDSFWVVIDGVKYELAESDNS